jgi:hypothetical protein
MPTAEQIRKARRLMGTAELLSIRLVRSGAECFVPLLPARGRGPYPRMFVSASAPRTAAKLIDAHRLLATAEFRLIARLGESVNSQPALKLRGSFELIYAFPDDLKPGKEEVTAFCRTNVMLNSWPYWRELVQNAVSRMSLPPLVLPLFRLAPAPTKSGSPPKIRKPNPTLKKPSRRQ